MALQRLLKNLKVFGKEKVTLTMGVLPYKAEKVINFDYLTFAMRDLLYSLPLLEMNGG